MCSSNLLHKSKVGDSSLFFSIATSSRCRKGHYSFPEIGPLYPWYVPYNADCLVQFSSLVWLDLGLNLGLPGYWRNPRLSHTKDSKNGSWYLKLSFLRYASRIKWSKPGKGTTLSYTSRCCSYWKGSPQQRSLTYQYILFLIFLVSIYLYTVMCFFL